MNATRGSGPWVEGVDVLRPRISRLHAMCWVLLRLCLNAVATMQSTHRMRHGLSPRGSRTFWLQKVHFRTAARKWVHVRGTEDALVWQV